MTKRSDPIESDERGPLVARVQSWLEQQGYPLELQVGQIASGAGWAMRHEVAYVDPHEEKTRTIDVLAQAGAHNGRGEMVSVALAIECKQNGDPWVTVRSEATEARLVV